MSTLWNNNKKEIMSFITEIIISWYDMEHEWNKQKINTKTSKWSAACGIIHPNFCIQVQSSQRQIDFSIKEDITEFWHKKEDTEEKQVGHVIAAPKSRSGATQKQGWQQQRNRLSLVWSRGVRGMEERVYDTVREVKSL